MSEETDFAVVEDWLDTPGGEAAMEALHRLRQENERLRGALALIVRHTRSCSTVPMDPIAFNCQRIAEQTLSPNPEEGGAQ